MTEGWERSAAGGFRWLSKASARRELESALFGRAGGDLGAPLDVARLRRGRSFHALASQDGGLFVKRLAPARYDVGLLYRVWAGRVRGQREFRLAVAARARGAPVPEPLALGVRHRPLRSYESLLVYRRLPGDPRPLGLLGLGTRPAALRERIAGELGRLAARLHECGVFHMDLTPLNAVLVGDPDGAFSLVAVDLETIELGAPGDLARARRSLDRTHSRFAWPDARERIRFDEAYRAARRQPGAREAPAWSAAP